MMISTGEIRHEQCRFGTLTEAYHVDAVTGKETPGCLPICVWKLPEKCPPGVLRAWGGLVNFEKDCAVCPCFSPL